MLRNPYELYEEIKYLYLEGRFETLETKDLNCYTLKYHKDFFKNSKFSYLNILSSLLCLLPYEFNMKFPALSLQTSEYCQIKLFKQDSYMEYCLDSSLDRKYDTGKKLTFCIAYFPKELNLSERRIILQYRLVDDDSESEIILDKPGQIIVFKSRIVSVKAKSNDISFSLIFYYIHGPIDEERKF